MQTSREISSTAQKFLEIHDIANDLLILKDGATALIITVSAMNFGLLAEEEQDAIIYSYAGLLNSLNYPIQIVIKSQTKDVTSYLHLLDNELEVATSHTKREWIKKYRSFVANLIRERNVLDKKFYVVIPATALEMGLLPPSTVIPGVQQPDLSTVEKSVILQKAREILEPKRDHLMNQFGRIGLIARQLTTQEIIQLFYLSYNPEAAEGQQITDTNSYTTPLVRASVIKGGNMVDSTQISGSINNGAADLAGGPTLVAPATTPAAMAGATAIPTAEDQATMTPPAAPVTPPVETPVPTNLGAVVPPATTSPTALNSSADNVSLNEMQSVINSAAQEVAPAAPVSTLASAPATSPLAQAAVDAAAVEMPISSNPLSNSTISSPPTSEPSLAPSAAPLTPPNPVAATSQISPVEPTSDSAMPSQAMTLDSTAT